MKNLSFFLFGFLFSISIALYSSTSTAVEFAAQAVMSAVPTSAGAQVSVQYAGKTAANQAVYAVRSVPVSKAIIGNVVKARAFNPWGIAVVAAVTAAGYYINESTGLIESTGSMAANYSGVGECYSWTNAVAPIFNVSADACLAHIDPHVTYSTVEYGAWNGVYYKIINPADGPAFPNGWFQPNDPASIVNTSLPPNSGGAVEATPEELYDVAVGMSQPSWEDLFQDTLSGKPNPAMPPLYAPIPDINADYDAANDGDPATIPTVDLPNGDTGTDDISDEKPENKDPCVKNPDLLSCLEVDDVPDPTEIQTQAAVITYTSHFLSSNASCPSPVALPYGEMSYQPACDFATGLKPMILIVFSVISLMIVGGVKT